VSPWTDYRDFKRLSSCFMVNAQFNKESEWEENSQAKIDKKFPNWVEFIMLGIEATFDCFFK